MVGRSCDPADTKHLVAFGDSVTQGVPHVAPDDTYVRLLERRLNVRLWAQSEVCITNAGVGGETSREGLARIETDVLSIKPTLVIVQFGLNDIRYEPEKRVGEDEFAANLRRINELVRGAGGMVLFMTPNPIIDMYHVYSQSTDYYSRWGGCNGANAAYARIVREVAAEVGAYLSDIYEIFLQEAVKGEFKGETFDYTDLSVLGRYISTRDGVHPTAAGHELIAAECYRLIVTQNLLATRV